MQEPHPQINVKMEEYLTRFAAVCVCVATVGVGGVAFLVAKFLGANRKWSTADKLTVVWLVYNSLTHFILEGSFLYHSLTGTVNTASGILADVWKEYAKADRRWGESDPTIVSLELLTVFFNGFLCLVLIESIINSRQHRHFVQIVLNVCELYGGWMTFAPEWVTGSTQLNTSNWLYLWVYLVFFNGLWVIIPLLLLLHSYQAITAPTKKKKN